MLGQMLQHCAGFVSFLDFCMLLLFFLSPALSVSLVHHKLLSFCLLISPIHVSLSSLDTRLFKLLAVTAMVTYVRMLVQFSDLKHNAAAKKRIDNNRRKINIMFPLAFHPNVMIECRLNYTSDSVLVGEVSSSCTVIGALLSFRRALSSPSPPPSLSVRECTS